MPTKNELLQLARLAMPFVRFLHPDIIHGLVDDNERNRHAWEAKLSEHGMDPTIYIWDRCACAFPGVRRYAGSTEIAQFRGRAVLSDTIVDAVRLDDNSFPKQIWSFIFCGKPFQNVGPPGYALAHLIDHKVYKNRSSEEFHADSEGPGHRSLYGLYTCATNTVYMPSSLIKPTDFAGPMRNLLQRKASDLYGEFCNLLPPHLQIRTAETGAWALDAFDWSDPVGTMERFPDFLEFRRSKMHELL